jgi:hypothetical protein
MGIDKVSDLIATGVKLGVIGKSGAFIDIEGVKHQGMEKARNALAEDLKLYEIVNKKVRDAAAGVNLTTGEVK